MSGIVRDLLGNQHILENRFKNYNMPGYTVLCRKFLPLQQQLL